MDAESRRKKIIEFLSGADKPVSASKIAKEFKVSRQIIVGDVALIRAAGTEIEATPRGYILRGREEQNDSSGIVRRVASKHTAEQMQAEIYTIVDNGCTVIDVIVEHPVYGQLAGSLHLKSRYDVDQFIEKVEKSDALPLSFLTEGIHLHTLSCPDEASWERVRDQLEKKGYLLDR